MTHPQNNDGVSAKPQSALVRLGSTDVGAALRKAAPFLFPKKKRAHTHFHYSHKRAQAEKPVVTHQAKKELHIFAETPDQSEEITSDFEKGERGKPHVETHSKDTEKPAAPVASVHPKTNIWSLLKTRLSKPVKMPAFFAKKAKPVILPAPMEPSAEPMAAAMQEPVSDTVPVPETDEGLQGKILTAEKPVVQTKAEIERTKAALLAEEGFMQKVKLQKKDHERKKWNAWGLLKERLFQPMEMPSFLAKKQPATAPAETLTKEDLENDTFLKRVQKKDTSAPVGTQVDEEDIATADVPVSTLASFASGAAAPADTAATHPSRILPPLEKKKDEPAAIRREEHVTPAVPEQKAEEKKPEEKPVPKIVIKKNSSAFSNYIASLSYMGLGKERMMFIQNMATMLNAGLPLIDALRTILLETRNKSMKKIVTTILASVENGSPFWRAMDDRHFFSLHAIALVRIGEEAGSLAENMEYLAMQEEKDHELKGKVKMAMIYPSIVMTIMFILVIGLGWFVLPNLIGVLYSLGVPLPFVTRAVIAFTNFFTNYGTVAVPGMLIGMFVIVILNKTTNLKIPIQWLMFHVPGVGTLAREATIARFGVILGGLLKAGVPVIEAVQSLIEVTPIVSYRNLYTHMLEHITIGDSFSKSFQSIKGSEKLLPPSVQQLVVTGEKSGSLADILLKVADIYDKKASETAQKLPVILEPMILLFIGGLVGTIAFAIIVPIYGIVGTVGR